MTGSERLFRDRQSALEEGFRLGVAALVPIYASKVVEARGDVWMVWTEGISPDRQGTLVERLGFGVAALGPVQKGQDVEQAPRGRVI